jgi:GT2 family glycosyltransferase
MMPGPDVSIVVVSYNTRDLLRACLCSVRATAGEMASEVIVVDNASTDGSVEMLARDFPEVTLVANAANVGFAAANNQAIRLSRGRYVLLLNSDAILQPGAVRALVDCLERTPRAGVAGGLLLNADGSFQFSFADPPSLRGEIMLALRLARRVYGPEYPSYREEHSRVERDAGWVSGAFLLARRAAIEDVGLLDEGYFMYSEETDWCHRMRHAGWSVRFVPAARVTHFSGQSARRSPERRRSQVYRSKWRFFRKHRGRPTAAAFRGTVWLASVCKLAGWALRSLTGEADARARARGEARSYAYMLRGNW